MREGRYEDAARLNYEVIAGINQRIDEVNANPAQMPAEYPALGRSPIDWHLNDSVSILSA